MSRKRRLRDWGIAAGLVFGLGGSHANLEGAPDLPVRPGVESITPRKSVERAVDGGEENNQIPPVDTKEEKPAKEAVLSEIDPKGDGGEGKTSPVSFNPDTLRKSWEDAADKKRSPGVDIRWTWEDAEDGREELAVDWEKVDAYLCKKDPVLCLDPTQPKDQKSASLGKVEQRFSPEQRVDLGGLFLLEKLPDGQYRCTVQREDTPFVCYDEFISSKDLSAFVEEWALLRPIIELIQTKYEEGVLFETAIQAFWDQNPQYIRLDLEGIPV